MSQLPFSRRKFLAASSASALLAAVPHVRAASPSANNRLRLAIIGVGVRGSEHLKSAIEVQNKDQTIEIAALCDVFNRRLDEAAHKVKQGVGKQPRRIADYRELLADPSVDAVIIATPDHWHARQAIDALDAKKHVYCEKPMTHSLDEALMVHKAWKDSGQVMQIGVQSTSLPVWRHINEHLCSGNIGKVLQYQTEFFRNSDMGQWRYYPLEPDMTPKNIDWQMFLGTEWGLAPEMPFDRALFAQWRCYWEFGSGMFTDLFVHRTTSMLLATGLRFPGRVVGAGGIFLEYDGRSVPDVATVVADFPEGVQGLVTATMCCANTPIKQLIRGHYGSIVLGNGEEFSGYDFVAERPQVTHDSSMKDAHVEVGSVANTSLAHMRNFIDAARRGDPKSVNCSPELGAAAMTIVKLGARSYREGKVFHFDSDRMLAVDADASWAAKWEKMSEARAACDHIAGWHAGDKGSLLRPEPYQSLAGPWIDGRDPAIRGTVN